MRVYPSTASVPERLLRVSIAFAKPPDPAVARGVRLVDGTRTLVSPFVDPPLWSSDGKVVTLLLDPSRQKLGLAAHRRAGFVLPAGRRVRLLLDGRSRASWFVRPGGCAPLDASRWHSAPLRAGTREPLVVAFGAPVDALSRDRIAVAAPVRSRVRGRAPLAPGERSWSFVPAMPWRPGVALAIHPRFEDPCGDEIGEPFEHAPGAGLAGARRTTFMPLRFRAPAIGGETTVRRAPRAIRWAP